MLHNSITLILGIGILGGITGAAFFQKLNLPQVIGYIIAGLIIGESGFTLSLKVILLHSLHSAFSLCE